MSITKVTHFYGAHAVMDDGSRDDGVYISVIGDDRRFRGLDKVASACACTAVTQSFVEDRLPSMIVPGNVYLLDVALGAGEAWSSNINADWFGESMLQEKTPTFESHAHPFEHHDNKDPKKARGRILFAAYNPAMRRTELVTEINREKGPSIAAAVDKGQYPRTSMGFRATFDVCSICGNVARSRSQYCKHLRFQPNEILPDGRKVYAINTEGHFFDHSYVMVPADRTAGTISILKVAGVDDPELKENVLSADVAAELGVEPAGAFLFKTASDQQPATEKLARAFRTISSALPLMAAQDIEKLASIGTFDEVLSTTASLGVLLRPAEFQYLALARNTDPAIVKRAADGYRSAGPGAFDPALAHGQSHLPTTLSSKLATPQLRQAAAPLVGRCDLAQPLARSVIGRVHGSGHSKLASDPMPRATANDPLARQLSRLYASYAKDWASGVNRMVKSAEAQWSAAPGMENWSAGPFVQLFATHGQGHVDQRARRALDSELGRHAKLAMTVTRASQLAEAGVMAKMASTHLTALSSTANLSSLDLDSAEGLIIESCLC